MQARPAATLLRYRFDSVSQARAHLHIAEKRTLFFYRDGGIERRPGEPALIELAFRDSEQTRLLLGSTLETMLAEGTWLEFPHQGMVSSEVESGLLSRRQHRRLGADLPVELVVDGATFAARLHDLSLVGARLRGEGLALRPGGHVTLRPLPAPLAAQPEDIGPAVVVWSNKNGAGLYFDREDAGCRAAVGTLHLALQRAWKSAFEAAHPAACCRGGALLEPPLPR